MASQNEKQLRLLRLNGTKWRKFQDKKHHHPIEKGDPFRKAIQRLYIHKNRIGIRHKNLNKIKKCQKGARGLFAATVCSKCVVLGIFFFQAS